MPPANALIKDRSWGRKAPRMLVFKGDDESIYDQRCYDELVQRPPVQSQLHSSSLFLYIHTSSSKNTAIVMRLRNAKDTVRPTIFETLADVHPLELDEGFHFLVKDGSTVWICPESGKWRRGIVLHEGVMRFDKTGIIRQFYVEYGKGANKKTEIFQPMWGNMKPDTPEVHELLRRNGYFV